VTDSPAGREPADSDAVAHVFVDELGERCHIEGDDGHHLSRVRRVRTGELVTAADGSGAWRLYEVVAVSAGALDLDARAEPCIARAPDIAITIAPALTKHGLDDVVAAVTELGVQRLTPVHAQRSIVRWDESRAARATERLRTIAREAAMQSRRARIPEVDAPVALVTLTDRPGVIVADRLGVRVDELARPGPSGWTVLVGPEGGLAAEELAALASAPRLRLGRHLLRAGTAPVAAAAVLAQEAARLGPK